MRANWKCLSREDTGFSPRSSSSCVVFDEKIYVWGGEQVARQPIDAKMMCFNLSENNPSWTVVETKGDVPCERFAHTMAAISHPDGDFIYMFGGRQGVTMNEAALNDVHRFNFRSSTWEAIAYTGDAPSARSFHAMTSIGSSLYVFGGCPDNHAPRSNELFCFDTIARQWSKLPTHEPMRGRGGPTLEPSADGKALYVIGGFAGEEMGDMYRFDLSSQTGSEVSSTFRPRSVCASATLCPVQDSAGIVAVFGGEVDASMKGHEGAGDFANDLVLLDDGGSVHTVEYDSKELPGHRGWACACAISPTSLVVVGGLAGNDANPVRLGDVWRLTLTDTSAPTS
jgi:hypothetical protein